MARGLEDYVPVHVRLANFRNDYPQGKVETVVTAVTAHVAANGPGTIPVFVTAKISDENGNLLATGSSYCADVNDVEKELEKAETSAVGRALAFVGYEIKDGIASQEEMEDFEEKSSRKSKLGKRLKTKAKAEPEETDDESEAEEDEAEEPEEKPKRSLKKLSKKAKPAPEPEETEEDEAEESEDESDEEETPAPANDRKAKMDSILNKYKTKGKSGSSGLRR